MTDPYSPEKAPLDMTREEYMRTEGFVLYTAMNVRLLDEVRAETLKSAEGNTVRVMEAARLTQLYPKEIHQANIGLHLVTSSVVNGSTIIPAGNYEQAGLQRVLEISDEDIVATEGKGIYNYGLDDRGFPWNFAAGVAAAAVHAFVRDGKIESAQAASLGLGDWAELIASDWFSKIMHSLAFTHNSIYQHFGAEMSDFNVDSFETQLNDRLRFAYAVTDKSIEHALVTSVGESPHGRRYEARLNSDARTLLRQAMTSQRIAELNARGSTGCPVARRVTRLPAERARQNPHVTDLADRGIFNIIPDSKPGYVQIEQPLTAIDRTLLLHAEKLEEYDRRFGMPVPDDSVSGPVLKHKNVPPTSALILEGAAEA